MADNKVTRCTECNAEQVRVDPGGFLAAHKKGKRRSGPLCNGGGRHITFNKVQEGTTNADS